MTIISQHTQFHPIYHHECGEEIYFLLDCCIFRTHWEDEITFHRYCESLDRIYFLAAEVSEPGVWWN